MLPSSFRSYEPRNDIKKAQMMRTLIFFLSLCMPCMAQKSSVAKVHVSGGIASCVIIEKERRVKDGFVGYALTSYHVVCKGDPNSSSGIAKSFFVEHIDGTISKDCSVAAIDSEADLAMIKIWMPESSEPAKISENISSGPIETHGFGYGKYGVDKGSFLKTFSWWSFFDASCQPGDSGGGVFQNGELVGVISGGWERHATPGGSLPEYWPVKSTSADSIRSFINTKEPSKHEPSVNK